MMKWVLELLFIVGFSAIAIGQVWIDNSEVVGAVALGRGGTVIAIAGEVDAVWSNPAGLALLPALQVSLGAESFFEKTNAQARWEWHYAPDYYEQRVYKPDRAEGDENQFSQFSVGFPLKVAIHPAAFWMGYRRILGFPDWRRAYSVQGYIEHPDWGPLTSAFDYTAEYRYSGGVDDWGAAFAMEILPRLRIGLMLHVLAGC